MNADDFRDYMLAFLFLRYLSDNYETAAQKELGADYPQQIDRSVSTPLQLWYESNLDDVAEFEKQMRRKVHYVIEPQYLWGNIAEMARTQDDELLRTLQRGFKYIEEESFASTFRGLFSEINLASDKLGRAYPERNARLCKIIAEIAKGLGQFSTDSDTLGDAYEYLIGQFAAGSGKKAGEFYTPQRISDILSAIVTLDSQEPATGKRSTVCWTLPAAQAPCCSTCAIAWGRTVSARFMAREEHHHLQPGAHEYAAARDEGFGIRHFHGDTLLNEWDMLRETNPAKMPRFDASCQPTVQLPLGRARHSVRTPASRTMGLAPKSAADFSFLLHGFHFLKQDGVMAIIPPHGVLFRGGAEAYPHQVAERWPHRHGDRSARQPILLHRHPCVHLGTEEVQKAGRCVVHQPAEHFDKGKRQNRLLRTDEMPGCEIGHIERSLTPISSARRSRAIHVG